MENSSKLGTKRSGFSLVFLMLAAIAIAYIAYPLVSVMTIIEPTKLLESVSRPEVSHAFFLSMITASISTLITATFGIPLSYFLARYNFKGKFFLNLVLILPLVLPPLASGALLLGVFGPHSSLGRLFPIDFTQSIFGIIIAQTYVAFPFMVLPARAAFESVDESYEKISRVLGKNKMETFFQISLPLARTGIIVGLIMTWVRSVGELGATLMMAYNPHTLSIQIFEDNAVGGLQYAVPDLLFALVLSVIILVIFSIFRKREFSLGW